MGPNQNTLREAALPADVANAFQEMTGRDAPPETLAGGITAVESMLEGDGFMISVDQMYQPAETRHRIRFEDRTEHVPCVLDALIAGLLVEASPVEVRSVPPNGEHPVHLSINGSHVSMDPSTAVFSWGIAASDIQNSDPEAAVTDDGTVSLASCSYINAFPDEEAYQQWAEHLTDAAVMQLNRDAMIGLAERAADAWVVN